MLNYQPQITFNESMQTNKSLHTYIENHTQAEDEVLKELSRQTHLKVLRPRMLSEHIQGEVLSMLSAMIKPEQILELGTFTGYSAICLAKGLTKNGKLHTIDINDELDGFAAPFFEKAGFKDQIISYFGDALSIIPTLNVEFDLVFIDADKREYLAYYHAIFDKVKTGGFIIADNIFWDGNILSSPEKHDAYTKGIIDFNEYVHNDTRVENVIFPIRDGLMILRKK